MGFTQAMVEVGKVGRSNGSVTFEKVAGIEMLVDTGATYSCLPAELLKRCEVAPERTERLTLADGKQIQRTLGYVSIVVEGIRIFTPALFGEPGDPNLLGVLALEDANLSVDPRTRKLLRGTSYIQYCATAYAKHLALRESTNPHA